MKTLSEDPQRRLFAYKILDDKYGTLFDDEEQNVQSFLQGDDQKAYDRLMRIVNDNASNSSKGR